MLSTDTRLTRRQVAALLGATMIPTSTAVAQNQRFRLLLNTSYSGPVSFVLLAQERRFTFAYIFGAAKTGLDEAFALVLTEANTEAMQIFLDAFSKTLPSDAIAIMFADQAGWHGAKALIIPANVRLLSIPAYTPEVNPIERVWLYLKERYLSHRLHDAYDSLVDAACNAWNRLRADTGKITSLRTYPWLEKCPDAVRI